MQIPRSQKRREAGHPWELVNNTGNCDGSMISHVVLVVMVVIACYCQYVNITIVDEHSTGF